MLIELVGLPGSGKTTFSRAFGRMMRRKGLDLANAHAIATDITQNRRTPRFVKAKPERALLHRYIRFQRRHPELDALCVDQFEDRPIGHLLFTIMAASFQGVRDLETKDDVVLLDEGFITHGIFAFLDASNAGLLDRYVSLAPLVDMVWVLDLPAKLAFERTTTRVGDDAAQQQAAIDKHGDLTAFTTRRKLMMRAVEAYEKRGVPIEMFNTVDTRPRALANQAFDAMKNAVSA